MSEALLALFLAVNILFHQYLLRYYNIYTAMMGKTEINYNATSPVPSSGTPSSSTPISTAVPSSVVSDIFHKGHHYWTHNDNLYIVS